MFFLTQQTFKKNFRLTVSEAKILFPAHTFSVERTKTEHRLKTPDVLWNSLNLHQTNMCFI